MMRRLGSHRNLAVLAAAAALGAVACARRPTIDEHRARVAVREYNLALPRAYREKQPDLLKETATENQIGRIWPLVLGLSQRGLVLESRLEETSGEEVRVTGRGQAEVVATEVWWYRHVDPATGRVGQEPKRVRSRIRYALVRQGDRWLVDKLEVLETRDLPASAGR